MKKFPIVLDLETKLTFRDAGRHKDLGISVVGIYDYADDANKVFFEKDLSKLFPLLERASYVIGFNIRSFDLQVLAAYYPGDINQFAVFDICDDVKNKLGNRLSLNDLGYATLGKKKTGHGFIAIDLYNQGKWDELQKYCLDDVNLTRDIFNFGVKNNFIHYLSPKGKEKIEVDWKKYLQESSGRDTALTLPF
jgi:DEAD/DEAH box helicase domain-containing protein